MCAHAASRHELPLVEALPLGRQDPAMSADVCAVSSLSVHPITQSEVHPSMGLHYAIEWLTAGGRWSFR